MTEEMFTTLLLGTTGLVVVLLAGVDIWLDRKDKRTETPGLHLLRGFVTDIALSYDSFGKERVAATLQDDLRGSTVVKAIEAWQVEALKWAHQAEARISAVVMIRPMPREDYIGVVDLHEGDYIPAEEIQALFVDDSEIPQSA